MGTLQKVAVFGIALAMITTVSLPNRKFDKVLDAGGRFATGLLSTAMGTNK